MTDDNTTQTNEQTPKVPRWASGPFGEFMDFVENLRRVLTLSITGISLTRGVPAAIEWMAKYGTSDDESVDKRLKMAHDNAEFAQKELDSGFPLLYAQATVTLWGGLESLVRVFLAEWLKNESSAMRVPQIRKLKIQLGDYEALLDDEKPYYILDLLEREIQFPLKQGIGRFETLFELFGLTGKIDEDTKKNIFEMNQVRNLLVHHRGIANRKFITACSWLDINAGDVIKISRHDFLRYSNSVTTYMFELMLRVGEHFGESREEFFASLKSEQD